MNIILKTILFVSTLLLIGCSSKTSFLASNGPSSGEIFNNPSHINVFTMNEDLLKQISKYNYQIKFSDIFTNNSNIDYTVGEGDILDITIFEAAPATLFSTFDIMGTSASRNFPSQVVQSNGKINIPFAGEITASGKTLREIEKNIISRLSGKANQPQVIVNLSKNTSKNVIINGEVKQNMLLSLSPSKERVLDALAIAGGTKQQISKISIQLSRNNKTITVPLETIIESPLENIILQPKDIITAIYQSKSFTALGATGKNEEVEFEAKGITLAQALGRVSGLKDQIANKQGVFIFRWENENVFDSSKYHYKNNKIPVIYRFDLSDPATFFMAQKFMINDKDILYISSASSVELQRFINILTSSIYALATPINLTK